MLAEKVADLIRGRLPLEPLDVPIQIAPNWERPSSGKGTPPAAELGS
jgi:hypothetical protein